MDVRLRLLLLLSALIAGFTGLVAGTPARAREPMAIAAALSGASEQDRKAVAVRPVEPPVGLASERLRPSGVAPAITPRLHRVDERRII